MTDQHRVQRSDQQVSGHQGEVMIGPMGELVNFNLHA